MKKMLAFALGLSLLASVSFAQDAAKKIELGINGGIAVATTSGYDMGFGGQVTGLYKVNPNLGIGLGIGYDSFPVTGSTSAFGASNADLSFLAILKYAFGDSAVKPYILVDAGLSNFMATLTADSISITGSTTYPEFGGGLGIQFAAGGDTNIFVQATINEIVNDGSSFTYIPVDAGVNFDL